MAAAPDDIWQGRHSRLAGDTNPAPEIIPKGDTQLGAGLGEPEEGIATVSADIATGTAADLSLGHDRPFILPMSGRSWKSIIRGIRVFDARLLFTT